MKRTIDVERQAQVFAALADPLRVRFVRALIDHGEHGGSALAERLGVSLALLCHHAKILVRAGIVEKRKEGQTTYYRANRRVLAEGLRVA